jgi:ABC-type phosphate/phosphonate transport system substrate-binding protein
MAMMMTMVVTTMVVMTMVMMTTTTNLEKDVNDRIKQRVSHFTMRQDIGCILNEQKLLEYFLRKIYGMPATLNITTL